MGDPYEKWMDEALFLAARGRGFVSPNPMVGAVVVKDGAAIGRGWHQEFGGPHAEVFALRDAGEDARGATLFCTLEPCNHFGKTPPCVQAVIDAGIATVVLGARDPHRTASGGVEALRAADVAVVEGVREAACRALNSAFFKFIQTGVPLIALKWAMSLDGKIAARSGDSKWITGDVARTYAHRLRAHYDAVLVGIGTVLADDPSLNARVDSSGDALKTHQPRRVILDSFARTNIAGNLRTAHPAGPVSVICCRAAEDAMRARIQNLRDDGVDVIEVEPNARGRVPVETAVRELGRAGVLSILVEGGASVLGAFVDARLADRAHVFVAPKIIGGEKGLTAVGGSGADQMADALKFIEGSTRNKNFGADVLIEGALTEWGTIAI